jgi:hypothetical protein
MSSKPRRVFSTLSRMQATGSSADQSSWRHQNLQTVADLPAKFVASLDAAEAARAAREPAFRGRQQSLIVLIRELHALPERRKLRLLLQELVQRLLDPNGAHAEDGAPPEEVGHYVAVERETFLRAGGDEALLRVLHALRQEDVADTGHASQKLVGPHPDARSLWSSPVAVLLSPAKSGADTSLRKHVLNDTMAILRELSYFSANLAMQLCDKDGLIVYLFQLMGDVRFFDNASGLVEEILAVREESFDLSRIRTWPRLSLITTLQLLH